MRTAYEIGFEGLRNVSRKVARWAHLDSKSGVTAVEYALLLTGIGAVIVAGAGTLGTALSTFFSAGAAAISW